MHDPEVPGTLAADSDFTAIEKQGLYRAIYERRDIRGEFLPDPIPDSIVQKLLDAAHHAGSVGFMQPWNFIIINDEATKRKVKSIFETENIVAAQNYEGAKKKKYQSLKLEGILEAPINLCVTCDRSRHGPHVVGRNTILDTDLYSTCCAIQNLWLAARAEGIGVGWVSIIDNDALKQLLNIPTEIVAVAYLAIGFVAKFPSRPLLEEVGWQPRIPLEPLIFQNRWDQPWQPKP